MNLFGPVKLISKNSFVWGVILMTTAVTHNATGLLANRFLLGLAEAAVGPGLSIVVSMWYKRSEQPLRHAGWFAGNSIAGVIGGFLAYGIGHIQSIEAWKAIFLIFGGMTVAWSIVILFALPDVPMTAWFLNETDRNKAIIRVDQNMTGMKSNEVKLSQCFECLLDVKSWLIVLIELACVIPNGGVGAVSPFHPKTISDSNTDSACEQFGTIVIEGFGFSKFHTLLLKSGTYVAQLVLMMLSTWGSSRFPNTATFWLAWNFGLAVIGTTLVRQLLNDNPGGRYAGYCLLEAFVATTPLLLSLITGNYGGFTKKTTMNAMVRLPLHAPGFTCDLYGIVFTDMFSTVLCILLRGQHNRPPPLLRRRSPVISIGFPRYHNLLRKWTCAESCPPPLADP